MLRISICLFDWTLLDVTFLEPPEAAEPAEVDYGPGDAGIAAVIDADDAEIRGARADRLGFVAAYKR